MELFPLTSSLGRGLHVPLLLRDVEAHLADGDRECCHAKQGGEQAQNSQRKVPSAIETDDAFAASILRPPRRWRAFLVASLLDAGARARTVAGLEPLALKLLLYHADRRGIRSSLRGGSPCARKLAVDGARRLPESGDDLDGADGDDDVPDRAEQQHEREERLVDRRRPVGPARAPRQQREYEHRDADADSERACIQVRSQRLLEREAEDRRPQRDERVQRGDQRRQPADDEQEEKGPELTVAGDARAHLFASLA